MKIVTVAFQTLIKNAWDVHRVYNQGNKKGAIFILRGMAEACKALAHNIEHEDASLQEEYKEDMNG